MIKYAKIEGFRNLGEVELFSHIYQFIELKKEHPKTILIEGYTHNPNKVFKGYVFRGKQTWDSVPLTPEEKEVIASCVGNIVEVDFTTFISGIPLLEGFKDFKHEPYTKGE